jgi:hypothetical protein
MLRVLIIYPPSVILIFLWHCPLDGKQKNQQVSYGYAGQDQKRQNNDNIINKPSSTPKENSHVGIGTLIPLSKLTDEMDPNYILHASRSQHEERSDKWARPPIATEKKVNQNEAIFNFLEHSSLILNEWAVSDDCLDYMKLEPDLSNEKEGDSRKKGVGSKKQVGGQKGKKAKKAAPPSKVENGMTTPHTKFALW